MSTGNEPAWSAEQGSMRLPQPPQRVPQRQVVRATEPVAHVLVGHGLRMGQWRQGKVQGAHRDRAQAEMSCSERAQGVISSCTHQVEGVAQRDCCFQGRPTALLTQVPVQSCCTFAHISLGRGTACVGPDTFWAAQYHNPLPTCKECWPPGCSHKQPAACEGIAAVGS
jgi:hypothetical protein